MRILHFLFMFVFILFISPAFPQSRLHSQSVSQNYNPVAILGRGIISSATWKPNAETLIVNTDSGAWIYTSNFEVLSHFENVHHAGYSPDGSLIAAVNEDQSMLLLWDTENYSLLKQVDIEVTESRVKAIAWNPDNTQIAVGFDHNVQVIDLDTEEIRLSFSFETPVVSLTWKPDGKRLAVGRVANVDIIELEQGLTYVTLPFEAGNPMALWSPDHQTLATLAAYSEGMGSIANAIKVWDDDGRILKLVIQAPYAQTIAWNPDGTMVASSVYTDVGYSYPIYFLQFWNTKTGEILPLSIPDNNSSQQILSIDWDPDGTRIMVTLSDNTVRLYEWPLNPSNAQAISILSNHSGPVTDIDWNPDGTQLASSSEEGVVRVWSLDSQSEIAHFPLDTSGVLSLSWSPNGEQIAAGTNESMITILNALSGEQINSFIGHQTEPWHSGVSSLAWSPDSDFLASGGNDSFTQIWDADNFEKLYSFDGLGFAVNSLAWDSEGEQLAYPGGTAHVWSINQNNRTFSCEENGVVEAIALSPDGHFIAVSDSNYGTCIWDINENVLLPHLMDYAIKLDWNPDGTKLAAIVVNVDSNKQTLQIWSTDSWEILSTIDPLAELTAIAWSPDGQYLAAGDRQGTIHVWE